MKNTKITTLLSSAGMLAGLYYAFKTGQSFWGYVGYGLLGSIAGGASGQIISIVIQKQ